MEADPSVLTVSNTVGIDQVRKGKHRYAFLMESSMIEYNIERDCNLTQIGKLLDAKNYGIALPFRKLFDYNNMNIKRLRNVIFKIHHIVR